MKQKSETFYNFAEQILNLIEIAERMDQEVADAITAQRDYTTEHNKSLRIEDWRAKLLELLVDIGNSIPLLALLADILEGIDFHFKSLKDSIKHWYECDVKAIGTEIGGNADGVLNTGKTLNLSDVFGRINFGKVILNEFIGFAIWSIDTTGTYSDILGIAGAGAYITKLFQGKGFKQLKNQESSDLKNSEGNGNVDLKRIIKQSYSLYKNGMKELGKVAGTAEKTTKTPITLSDVVKNNPDSYPYDLDATGFYLAQQYYLAWYYGTCAYDRFDENALSHCSYLVYKLDKLRKRGEDLSALTVDEVDDMCLENESFWFKVDTAAIAGYTLYSAYLYGKEAGSAKGGTGTSKGGSKTLDVDELVTRDSKFLDANGDIDWEKYAPNGGRVPGTIKEGQTLDVGTVIDRYGNQYGKYTSPVGVPYEQRALPYIENPNAYHQYEVIKPIDNVTMSEVAEAFEQPGGGIQYELPSSIKQLIKDEFIKEIK